MMLISDGINHGKLQSIIVSELKKAGLKHRLKKIISKNAKDNKTVFGAPLVKVPSCSTICCGSTLNIPVVVSEMCTVLRENAHIEGLFRKAGSQARQKDIKKLLDSGGCISSSHHPIDVASVFKLYLRTLPEPLISAEVQDLLLRCRVTAGEKALQSILHTLLLLPVLHVHLLHHIMELLNFIASRHKENLMDSLNLAIVMTPSIMPLPATSAAQPLEQHVALVKMFIENSRHIGILTDDLMSKLDDDSEVLHARRKKRRSGSLNRVLHGLKKMVSGSVNTPAAIRENGKTPILSKSASKRKLDSYEGFSAKTRKGITHILPQKELSFTPIKMGITERKRVRLSMIDARSTPGLDSDFKSHIKSETSNSSEDILTSSEHLFSAHDTIDLSPDNKPIEKDYVRISKQEYEEIKSRVSAIETRLSREYTDAIPRVEPLQQVQNVYQQTLEDVAMLNCSTSDHLARRLSKELKIRPSEQIKIIRSPSARKIGTIRRRSKENVTKIVRHKSWNMTTQSPVSHNTDNFCLYAGFNDKNNAVDERNSIRNSENSPSENSRDRRNRSPHKYTLRKRASCAYEYSPKTQGPCSLNSTINSWDSALTDISTNNMLNSTDKSQSSEHCYSNIGQKVVGQKQSQQSRQKWRSAATFFMNKTGELDSKAQSGRPSVNKLRSQNAGVVLAKAKLFESSSDKSSERNPDKTANAGFARKPRISSTHNRTQKIAAKNKLINCLKEEPPKLPPKRLNRYADVPTLPAKYQEIKAHKIDLDWQTNSKNCKMSPPRRNVIQVSVPRTPHNVTPVLKKPLCPNRNFRSPAYIDSRKPNTPMRAVHVSPRRRSPRIKNI